MHSLTKLSCLFLLSAFVKRVCAQTVTALYIPSIANSGGLDSESFFDGTFEGTQNGKSSFQLVLGSNDDDPDDGPDITPTFTLVEASTTALLVASTVEDGTTLSINIQCSINGDSSSCVETDFVILGATTSSSVTSYTETVSPIPVTLVNALPSSTSTGVAQATSSTSGSPSNSPGSSPLAPFPSPSSGNPLGGSLSPVGSSPTSTPTSGSSSSNSPTTSTTKSNSANSLSMPVYALALVVLSVFF